MAEVQTSKVRPDGGTTHPEWLYPLIFIIGRGLSWRVP